MSLNDYIAIGTLAVNVVYLVFHKVSVKNALAQALSDNRKATGALITDVVNTARNSAIGTSIGTDVTTVAADVANDMAHLTAGGK